MLYPEKEPVAERIGAAIAWTVFIATGILALAVIL